MSSQSQNNFNIQNKLIRIDGEYVKLYVTTNKTLPKLLKNTGSLIVYHDSVLSEDNNFSATNHLYLGNNLIASGWGFHKEIQRNEAEIFLNYGNGSVDYKHIGSDEFNHNYYDIVRKLYDTIPFWEDDLSTKDVITNYELYLSSEIEQNHIDPETHPLPTFKSLYKDANVFDTINDIVTRICSKTNVENSTFIKYNSLLTNPNGTYSPYVYQDFTEGSLVEDYINASYLKEFTGESNGIIHDQVQQLYRLPIYLDMLPYMLGPAIYDKPEIKDVDLTIYYTYSKDDNGSGIREDNIEVFAAKKVNGKYQLPKGANIYSIGLEMDIKMNDAQEITGCSFEYMTTNYNEAKLQITEGQSDETTKISDITSTLLFDENIDISRVTISNSFRTFTPTYKTVTINVEKQSESAYGIGYTHVSFKYNLGNQLSIPIDTIKFIKNLYINVKGVNKLKTYSGFDNGYFYNATQLNSYKDNLRNHIMYSLEYAWQTTTVNLSDDIEIEPLDVMFIGTKAIDPISNNDNSIRYAFNTVELFGNGLNIASIYDNHSKKTLSTPLRSNNTNGSDILMIGIPFGKSIKNIFANVQYDNGIRTIRKDNITGLLKFVSNVNYFISLNPEMNMSDSDRTVYHYALITDLETNIYAQPYNVYFAILPRTYNNENTDNGIVSFEVEFDDEPKYRDYQNTFTKQTWSKFKNFNRRGSVNDNIITSTSISFDNIDIVNSILSTDFDIKFVSNTDYDGTHIFDLSMNLDGITEEHLETVHSINPLSLFVSSNNRTTFIEKYCDKLNNISL